MINSIHCSCSFYDREELHFLTERERRDLNIKQQSDRNDVRLWKVDYAIEKQRKGIEIA